MTKEQELNKKLAEWAGILCDEDGNCCPIDDGWFKFTESLDACFKWLVPKVIEKVGHPMSIVLVVGQDKEVEARILDNFGLYFSTSHEKEIATALCLAIEKLTNSEVQK